MAQLHTLSKNNTTVYHAEDGMMTVKLYHTDVVKFNDEKIILNSGGWETHTTKTRMNQASNQFGLGYYVFQRDFKWFVDYNGSTYDFYDGIEF